MNATTPSLFPVTLELVCPRHGLVKRFTVTSILAQQQWETFYRQRHGDEYPAVTCVPSTLVADTQELLA